MIAGTEKLKLIRELGVIRTTMPGVTSGANKLSLIKRVREIRLLLSVKESDSVALAIDPADKVSSLRAMTDYINTAVSGMPEALQSVELDTIIRAKDLLLRLPVNETAPATEDYQDFLNSLRPFSLNLNKIDIMEQFKSAGDVFSVDVEKVRAVQSLIDEVQKESINDSPEIAAKKEAVHQEYDQGRERLSALLKINIANGYTMNEIDAAADEYMEMVNKVNALWDQLHQLDRQKYTDRNAKIADLRANLVEPGKVIINTLLDSSPVTQEQAEDWANKQTIDKTSKSRLSKMGYKEADIRRDMAEFYRITRGKLRNIAIVSNGSRRANAGNIGHFEFNEVRPGSRFDKEVLWHELAHHLEADPAAKMAANGFLLKRRESETVYSLRSLTGNSGYGKQEGAYKDDFIDCYIGKAYNDENTEVFSMGIQYLSSPKRAASFLAKDHEMASLVAGYLQAELTPAMKALQTVQDAAAGLNQSHRDDAASKYGQAITTLAEGIDIVDDGWFDDLEQEDRDNIQGRYSLNDRNAKFLGSLFGYRVFSGKFKNRKTKRIGKGYAVIYTEVTGSMLDSHGSRHIPSPYFIHGELQDVKAAIKIAIANENSINSVVWTMFSGWTNSEAKVIEAADKISGNQS
ncbi:MAG: hypothetical protein ACXWT0_00385 [Methylobacter sp.]